MRLTCMQLAVLVIQVCHCSNGSKSFCTKFRHAAAGASAMLFDGVLKGADLLLIQIQQI